MPRPIPFYLINDKQILVHVVFCEKIIVGQLCKKLPIFMEDATMLPYSRRSDFASDPELVIFQLICPYNISVILITYKMFSVFLFSPFTLNMQFLLHSMM